MLVLYPGEEFKEIEVDKRLQKKYAISNYGRMISFEKEMFVDCKEIKGSTVNGYRLFRYKIRENDKVKNKHIFMYKLVAEHFLPQPFTEDQTSVIHLDFNQSNDHVSNLKWATRKEAQEYQRNNPKVIKARQALSERMKVREGKLTTTQVMRLKKILLDPNRKTRIRVLAKQFGVSEMQLYRIKSGENWSRVEVPASVLGKKSRE